MAATYVKIDPDGLVYPCCASGGKLRLGNIKETPFPEIWNGEAYRELRDAMNTGNYPAPCRDCKHLRRGEWEREKRAALKEKSSAAKREKMQASPTIKIVLNREEVRTGDTLLATARVANGPYPTPVEIKSWWESPDGGRRSIADSTFVATLEPYADSERNIFTCTLGGKLHFGTYTIGVRFLDPISGEEICADSVSFHYID
jgi:radical SAM protein with 4Fe4S-binding SPASM domain